MSENLKATPAFAIMISKDYGNSNETHCTATIGVAETENDAKRVLNDAFTIAKDAFITAMRTSGSIVYRVENDEKVEDFVILDNDDYKRISMYIPDDMAPFTEMVSVYIEETVMYKSQPEIVQTTMPCFHDNKTDINFIAGRCDLPNAGFVCTYWLETKSGSNIMFWKNETNGKVAISSDDKAEPTRIFNNRIDGNRWFKTYIMPTCGDKLIKI